MLSHPRFPRWITVLPIGLLILGACKSSSPATHPPAPPVSSATAAPQVELPTTISKDIRLDPAITQDADSLQISKLIYSGLVQLDSSGNVQPAVADSWVVSTDQLDYIFSLRSKGSFSDGKGFVPSVIADNFNRWFDSKSPLRGNGDYATWQRLFLGFHDEKTPDNLPKSSVDGIQVVDNYTVLIHLNRVVPDFLKDLADPAFSILEPTLLSGGNYGIRDSTIVSSGAYVVTSWTDAGLTLTPNPNYWGTPPSSVLNFTWK